MNPYLALGLAIASEVTATTALKYTAGFTRLLPSSVVVIGYGASFYLMTFALRQFSVGWVYAIWSGIGTAAIALLGWILFGESIGLVGLAGIALIIAGVALLNLFGATAH